MTKINGFSRPGFSAALAEGIEHAPSHTAPHDYSVRFDLSWPETCRAAVAKAIALVEVDRLEELVVVHNADTLDPIGASSHKPSAAVLAKLNTSFTSAIMVLAELTAKFQSAPCRKVTANNSSAQATRWLGDPCGCG
jgi:benzil reductase ((S)-benzoin forming)